MPRHRLLRAGQVVAAIVAATGVATLVVLGLETALGVPNASNVFLVAVVGIAIRFGTIGAAVTAVLSILTYNFLFTEPRFTLTVADPGEWLHLVLLLFVAVTVGQLAALQRDRAEAAVAREQESRALFDVTRTLATRDSTLGVLPRIADALAREADLARAWFTLGADDTDATAGQAYAALHHPESGGGTWTLVRPTGVPAGAARAARSSGRLLRVRIAEADGRPIGSIWAETRPGAELPDAGSTTLLRVAADLVAQALGHDRLEQETRRAEVAQQSDALKSALLESVSHDLRTPLASIRASAGTLMDPDVRLEPPDIRQAATSIDREAQRLNRLVGNLLDLSRIEAGALRTTAEALDLEDVVERAISPVLARAGVRRIEIAVEPDHAVRADPILLDEALINLLENAIGHTPDGSAIRISTTPAAETGAIRLTVEDSGPGVAEAALPRIFDKFYRSAGSGRPASGMGIGLAVVRGFVEAMGGRVGARRGELGGLAIDLELPAAAIPVEAEVAT